VERECEFSSYEKFLYLLNFSSINNLRAWQDFFFERNTFDQFFINVNYPVMNLDLGAYFDRIYPTVLKKRYR